MPSRLVSIITPSFNRDWIIEKCIDSIAEQSYSPIEHIVIDGASTDTTIAILKDKEKSCNLTWISEKDEGIYHAVNKGISLSTGDIVAYLNTDDFYFPYTVETVVNAFNSTDADIVYGDWVNLYYSSGLVEILPWMEFNKYDLLAGYNLPQPTVFIRREVFDQIGNFDVSYRLLADNEFFTRAALAGFKIIKIDEFIAGQTIHQNNLLAGNQQARAMAEEESRRYRNYHQKKYNVSGFYLLLTRLKNVFAFRLLMNYNALKLILSYLWSKDYKQWKNFIGYLKRKNIYIDRLKFLKFLTSKLISKGGDNRDEFAFLHILDDNKK